MKSKKDTLTSVLASSDFSILNKKILRAVKDSDTAILLSDLISKYDYFKEKGMLTEEGGFFNTAENIERDICIKTAKQRTSIDKLKKLGFISTFVRGNPPKRHYIIHKEALLEFMSPKEDIHTNIPITFNYVEYLKSDKWKNISEKIRTKFKYKCVLCDGIKELNVHHKNYKHIGDEENHLDDLILLCNSCHKKTHNIEEQNIEERTII